MPLIALLAQHIVMAHVALGELKAAGYVSDGKPNAWFDILKHATKEVRSTARMLSLSPASYLPKAKRQSQPETPENYYSRMAILAADEGRRDGPNNN